MRILTLGFACLSLGACATGSTVHIVAASPVAVSAEYTHTYSQELGAAVAKADSVCQRYGKRARMNGQPVRLNADRSLAQFDCVAP